MSHTDVEIFTQHWNKFLTKVKGKLIKETKKQNLDYKLAQEILSESKESWGSDFEASGRWLNEYSETDYRKGKRIHDILLHNMDFEEIPRKKNLLLILLYLIPLVCGGAGFLIAMFITGSLSIRISCAAVPAVLSVFTVRMFAANIKTKAKKQLITEYVDQLADFSDQIIETIIS